MPGPLAGWKRVHSDDVKLAAFGDRHYWTIHAKCNDGANCTGPGCRVSTGKTRRNG